VLELFLDLFPEALTVVNMTKDDYSLDVHHRTEAKAQVKMMKKRMEDARKERKL
jgi:hypothetical protein